MRYGFFGYEHRKTGINDVHFERIAFAEVNTALGGGHDAFKARLRPWALDVLRTSWHEAGLFNFTYCSVDVNDEPDEFVYEVLLAWDGTDEVTPDTAIGKAPATS